MYMQDKLCSLCGKEFKKGQRYLNTDSFFQTESGGGTWCSSNKNNIDFKVHYKCVPKKIRKWFIKVTKNKNDLKCPRCTLLFKEMWKYGNKH